jgi:Zn-dependent protease with chaperone function
MRRRDFVGAAALASGTAIIACLVVMPDPWHLPGPFGSAATGVIVAGALTLAIVVAARTYLHHRLSRRLLRLSRPTTVGRTAVRELSGIEGAFVAGIVRPQIFCSSRLHASLSAAELRGVLLHEQYHQLDRAPAKLVVLDAVAPLLRRFRGGRAWLVQRRTAFEVAADRYALRQGASRAALARALLQLRPQDGMAMGIGFASASELRLRALLDPASAPAPGTTWRWVVQLTVAAALLCVLVLPLR